LRVSCGKLRGQWNPRARKLCRTSIHVESLLDKRQSNFYSTFVCNCTFDSQSSTWKYTSKTHRRKSNNDSIVLSFRVAQPQVKAFLRVSFCPQYYDKRSVVTNKSRLPTRISLWSTHSPQLPPFRQHQPGGASQPRPISKQPLRSYAFELCSTTSSCAADAFTERS
jgi:hypothetical protein